MGNEECAPRDGFAEACDGFLQRNGLGLAEPKPITVIGAMVSIFVMQILLDNEMAFLGQSGRAGPANASDNVTDLKHLVVVVFLGFDIKRQDELLTRTIVMRSSFLAMLLYFLKFASDNSLVTRAKGAISVRSIFGQA